MASTSKVALLTSNSESDNTVEPIESDEVVFTEGSSKPKRVRRGRKNLITPALAATIDRTKTTNRNATMMITETIRSSGRSLTEFNINRDSIRKEHQKARVLFASNLHEKLKADIPLTVHWDGKLMDDLNSRSWVDRLAILVSGQGVSQLLEVPKIPSGTGEGQAQAVVDALGQWGITDNITALSFDTTASNTGIRGGAWALIEHKIG